MKTVQCTLFLPPLSIYPKVTGSWGNPGQVTHGTWLQDKKWYFYLGLGNPSPTVGVQNRRAESQPQAVVSKVRLNKSVFSLKHKKVTDISQLQSIFLSVICGNFCLTNIFWLFICNKIITILTVFSKQLTWNSLDIVNMKSINNLTCTAGENSISTKYDCVPDISWRPQVHSLLTLVNFWLHNKQLN